MRLALALFAVLLLRVDAAAAQELGRLFFSPDQRSALDARRKARVPDKPAAVVVASPTTKLNGFVKRSDGRSTVWVNGESLPEGAPDSPRIGAGRGDAGQVSVPLGEGGRRATLKPGEVLDRGTGDVRDVLGDGEIRIRRSP